MKKIKSLIVASVCAVAASPVMFAGVTEVSAAEDTKNIVIENQAVTVPVKGYKWVRVNGALHFVKDGKLVKGWYKFTKADGENTTHYSFFDKDNGRLYTGWRKMGKAQGEKQEHMSYFGGDGWLRTGWQTMGKGTKNSYGESQEKHTSYFGDDGWLRTGWQKMGKGTANPDGNSAVHYSYFGADGWLRTGWQTMGKGTKNSYGEGQEKHTSYFGDNGWLRTGWQKMGKGTANPDGNNAAHMSYFGGDGWLRTGWQAMGKGTKNSYNENSNSHMSYFGPNGWLRTGLQNMGTAENPDGKSSKHQSYFGGNGWLVENNYFTLNNVQYIADSKGWTRVVTSENDRIIVRAMQLVAKVTNNNMTGEQKLRACYDHIKNDYPEYNPRIPHYSGKDWQYMYANDIFINKGGNCISYGAAFAYMAKALGYENVVAVNGTGHGWAEINGRVYDPEWEKHHEGSFYNLSYDSKVGEQEYKWIFASSNPYARIKL